MDEEGGEEETKQKVESLVDAVKHCKMVCRELFLCFIWFTNSFILRLSKYC